MKKKAIILLTIICVIFSIPTQLGQAVVFPILDAVDDVTVQFPSTAPTVGLPTYYPPCDIIEISANTSYLRYTFVGTPIIDNYHEYNVTILWDNSGLNYSMCLAGNLTGKAWDSSDVETTFSNGTFSVLRNGSGALIYQLISSNTVAAEACDGMSFLVPFTLMPNITYTDPYSVYGIAKVKESVAVYPQLAIGPDSVLQTTSFGGWVCDSAGSGFCWIPLPDEGAIELPIILTLLGSSFIIILVIRRKRK